MKGRKFWCQTCGYVWQRITDPAPTAEINHSNCPGCHAGPKNIVQGPEYEPKHLDPTEPYPLGTEL